MATAAQRPCSYPGCGVLVVSGRCKAHKSEYHTRPSRALYQTKAWRDGSRAFLLEHPMCGCERCRDQGLAASVVDHAIPHRGDTELFFKRANWQALSKPCHDRKTARETNARREMQRRVG